MHAIGIESVQSSQLTATPLPIRFRNMSDAALVDLTRQRMRRRWRIRGPYDAPCSDWRCSTLATARTAKRSARPPDLLPTLEIEAFHTGWHALCIHVDPQATHDSHEHHPPEGRHDVAHSVSRSGAPSVSLPLA